MGPLTVLVRPKKRETEKKIGRIYVPLTVSDRQLIGEVVAVGSGTQETPMEAKVGDEVEYLANSFEVSIDNKDLHLLYMSNILFIRP